MVLNRARKRWPLSNLFRRSVHAADELVDLLLAVAPVTALGLGVPVALRDEATARRVELEGPEEVVRLLEGRADGVDLVDEVLHAVDAVLPESLRDDVVVHEGNAGLVNLAVSALVDEFLHGLQVRVSEGDVGRDVLQHVDNRLVHLEEDAVVQLTEAKELQNLARLRGELVDTNDTRAEDELRLGLNEELSLHLRLAAHRDELFRLPLVLLRVLHRPRLQRRPRRLALRPALLDRRLLLDELRHSDTLRREVLRDGKPLRHF